MKKFFNLLIALFPILSGYGLSLSLDFGNILLFVFGAGCCLVCPRRKGSISMPVGYMLFFIVALLLSLVWARSVPLRLLLFTVNLYFACCYAEKEQLWKYYSILVWVCAVFFLVQEASFYILGFRPSGILSFLPTVYGGDNAGLIEDAATSDRSSSFFLEPSYFAQFLVPYVAITLFSSSKNERKKAIIASVLLLAVRSGVGIFLLGIIWLLWFLFSNVKTTTKLFVSLAILTLLVILGYAGSGVIDYFSSRSVEMLSFTGEEQHQSSGFIRIFRGYFAFSELSVMNKFLGSNPADVSAIFDRSIYFGSESSNFINGIQTLLFYHGFIGTTLYLCHIILFPYKTKNKILLVLSISIFVLLLLESFYLSSRLFVMIVFMHLMWEENKKSQLERRQNITNSLKV